MRIAYVLLALLACNPKPTEPVLPISTARSAAKPVASIADLVLVGDSLFKGKWTYKSALGSTDTAYVKWLRDNVVVRQALTRGTADSVTLTPPGTNVVDTLKLCITVHRPAAPNSAEQCSPSKFWNGPPPSADSVQIVMLYHITVGGNAVQLDSALDASGFRSYIWNVGYAGCGTATIAPQTGMMTANCPQAPKAYNCAAFKRKDGKVVWSNTSAVIGQCASEAGPIMATVFGTNWHPELAMNQTVFSMQ